MMIKRRRRTLEALRWTRNHFEMREGEWISGKGAGCKESGVFASACAGVVKFNFGIFMIFVNGVGVVGCVCIVYGKVRYDF